MAFLLDDDDALMGGPSTGKQTLFESSPIKLRTPAGASKRGLANSPGSLFLMTPDAKTGDLDLSLSSLKVHSAKRQRTQETKEESPTKNFPATKLKTPSKKIKASKLLGGSFRVSTPAKQAAEIAAATLTAPTTPATPATRLRTPRSRPKYGQTPRSSRRKPCKTPSADPLKGAFSGVSPMPKFAVPDATPGKKVSFSLAKETSSPSTPTLGDVNKAIGNNSTTPTLASNMFSLDANLFVTPVRKEDSAASRFMDVTNVKLSSESPDLLVNLSEKIPKDGKSGEPVSNFSDSPLLGLNTKKPGNGNFMFEESPLKEGKNSLFDVSPPGNGGAFFEMSPVRNCPHHHNRQKSGGSTPRLSDKIDSISPPSSTLAQISTDKEGNKPGSLITNIATSFQISPLKGSAPVSSVFQLSPIKNCPDTKKEGRDENRNEMHSQKKSFSFSLDISPLKDEKPADIFPSSPAPEQGNHVVCDDAPVPTSTPAISHESPTKSSMDIDPSEKPTPAVEGSVKQSPVKLETADGPQEPVSNVPETRPVEEEAKKPESLVIEMSPPKKKKVKGPPARLLLKRKTEKKEAEVKQEAVLDVKAPSPLPSSEVPSFNVYEDSRSPVPTTPTAPRAREEEASKSSERVLRSHSKRKKAEEAGHEKSDSLTEFEAKLLAAMENTDLDFLGKKTGNIGNSPTNKENNTPAKPRSKWSPIKRRNIGSTLEESAIACTKNIRKTALTPHKTPRKTPSKTPRRAALRL